MSSAVGPRPRERILGVEFYTGSTEEVIEAVWSEGALVLAPSGPGLAVDWVNSAAYREALEGADFNLTDSGALLLGWWILTGRKLPRLSGYGFLRALLATPEARSPGATFWVMPNERELTINLDWLGRASICGSPCLYRIHLSSGVFVYMSVCMYV